MNCADLTCLTIPAFLKPMIITNHSGGKKSRFLSFVITSDELNKIIILQTQNIQHGGNYVFFKKKIYEKFA